MHTSHPYIIQNIHKFILQHTHVYKTVQYIIVTPNSFKHLPKVHTLSALSLLPYTCLHTTLYPTYSNITNTYIMHCSASKWHENWAPTKSRFQFQFQLICTKTHNSNYTYVALKIFKTEGKYPTEKSQRSHKNGLHQLHIHSHKFITFYFQFNYHNLNHNQFPFKHLIKRI